MNPTHRQEEKRLLEVTGVEWVVLVFLGGGGDIPPLPV